MLWPLRILHRVIRNVDINVSNRLEVRSDCLVTRSPDIKGTVKGRTVYHLKTEFL
jgi:hypothetical protein